MLEQVEELLAALGAKLLEWRRQGITGGRWEGTQLKAIADQMAHDFLVEGIGQISPDVPIISEEDLASVHHLRPADYWLIDPIDGTASFCGGFNGFVTQVAYMRGAAPVLGVVHAPALELTFSAVAGGKATCNGKTIRVNDKISAPTIIDNYPEPRGIAKTLFDTLPCGRYVESGSLGLKICRVADNTADLFVKDVVVKDWDLAPGHLVLQCAGGVLTTLDGRDVPYADGFERLGIVAATSTELAAQVLRQVSARSLL